jgi:Peptidase family M23
MTATHYGGQKYAFDFRMGPFTIGRATRGGLVTLVVEDRNKTSNPLNVKAGLEQWLPGNLLLIRHQDGSTSFYTHMPKNGVVPTEGDYVERGDVIIVVGNTGNSTGAHLHYHVTSTPIRRMTPTAAACRSSSSASAPAGSSVTFRRRATGTCQQTGDEAQRA